MFQKKETTFPRLVSTSVNEFSSPLRYNFYFPVRVKCLDSVSNCFIFCTHAGWTLEIRKASVWVCRKNATDTTSKPFQFISCSASINLNFESGKFGLFFNEKKGWLNRKIVENHSVDNCCLLIREVSPFRWKKLPNCSIKWRWKTQFPINRLLIAITPGY
jgi:hypothetical protein